MTEQFHQNRHGSEQHSQVRHGLMARAMEELYRPHPAKIFYPFDAKEELYALAARTLGDQPITYLEFGVHRGTSFTRILQRFDNSGSRFFGFDSFEGLPEKWSDEMDRGTFSTGGEMPRPTDERAAFIKGWFQNTVPEFLRDHPISGPVLVHFDADLYSSTLFLLTTLFHSIPDYYFIFDEFLPDEVIAMHDFTRAYPVEFQFTACTQDQHMRPRRIFGRMRRVPFSP
jgi:O-methyltransferase